MSVYQNVLEYTENIEKNGLLRTRELLHPQNSGLVHFDSNDYLSLSGNEELANAYKEGYSRFPTGSGSSMFLSGYHKVHKEVEEAFAHYLQTDECILFSSGYAANLAVTSLVAKIKATCFIDKSIHASIYDGLRLADVPFIRYFHNDLEDLSRKINTHKGDGVLITEGIFSMGGQIAPLNALCTLGLGALIVDEAHSFGILGAQGRGAVVEQNLSQHEVPLRIIPFGKSFAAQGALIAGQKEWIKALTQAARSCIYSTAISPALSFGYLATLDIIKAADDRRSKIFSLIQLFREFIKKSPFNWIDSHTPIQHLKLQSNHLTMRYARELRAMGISCSAIRVPTVTADETGLRILLNYHHELSDIEFLFEALAQLHEHTH